MSDGFWMAFWLGFVCCAVLNVAYLAGKAWLAGRRRRVTW